MNPFRITEPTCISFSGGRTSAFMLYKVLEAHDMSLPEDAIVCFANTGKEDEATLKFVQNCSDNWNVEIHWVEYRDADPAFMRVDFQTASRNGEPFEALIGLGSMIVGKGSKLLCDFGIRTDERSCYLLPTETLNSKELFLCVTGLLNSIERS